VAEEGGLSERPLSSVLRAVPWLLAGLLLAAAVPLTPAFTRPAYWLELTHQYFAVTVLALALTPIMITGGIDLSVGSVTVLAGVVVGSLWRDAGWPVSCAVAGGLVTGLAAGCVNGALVRLGLWPLVATLATRELFRGLALAVSGDDPVTRFDPGLTDWWRAAPGGVPWPAYFLALLFVVTYFVLHHTWVGRALFALGDNETAARFAAVPADRIKFGLYAWSGLLAGLCGAATVAEYGAAKPDADRSLELLAIAAVVIGGVRVTGGAGNALGTVVGVVTLATILAGLLVVAADWRDAVAGGLVVVLAVANEAAARGRESLLARQTLTRAVMS
jgi:ribose/xylose/arabinose/galactoside ABC-type transport system permease subunit